MEDGSLHSDESPSPRSNGFLEETRVRNVRSREYIKANVVHKTHEEFVDR